MHIVAFCACAYYLLQEKDKKKNIKWLVFIFALFVCGTGNISFNMTFNEWAWIDFRAYPGGPLAFLLEQQPNVNNTWGNSFSLIVGLLTDSLLVRFYTNLNASHEFFVLNSSRQPTDLSRPCRLSDVVGHRDPNYIRDSRGK